MTRSSSSKQFQIGNKRYQRWWYVSNYFFWRKKSTFPHRSYRLDIFFYWRGRRHRHSLNSLLVIRTPKNFISSTFYQRPINPMPIIRPSNKKPSSKDIRIVFPDFLPPKLDWLLTIVMLIGIRHCQVTVPNYCDNDCMFVMFISSSNEEKYA